MINVILITFASTLLYLSIANRLFTYIKILSFQGVLLFGVALLELNEMNTLNLVLILLETIIFKAVAVPMFINHIIKRNRITREAEPFLPNFVSLIIVTLIIIITIIIIIIIITSIFKKKFKKNKVAFGAK